MGRGQTGRWTDNWEAMWLSYLVCQKVSLVLAHIVAKLTDEANVKAKRPEVLESEGFEHLELVNIIF